MSDKEAQPQEDTDPKPFVPPKSQEELDALIGSRVARAKSSYKEVEEKAAKYDEQQEANKSELQKAIDRAEAAEAKVATLKEKEEAASLRSLVAKELEIPAELLRGEDEDSIRAHAELIKEALGSSGGLVVGSDGKKPSTRPTGTVEQQLGKALGII